jgi:hypothetical protein
MPSRQSVRRKSFAVAGLCSALLAVGVAAGPAAQAATPDGLHYSKSYATGAECHAAGQSGHDIGVWNEWTCVPIVHPDIWKLYVDDRCVICRSQEARPED